MGFVTCLKSAWDALPQEDRDVASYAAEGSGVYLAYPDQIEAADGTIYLVWDDHRITEDHAFAVAAVIEGV